MKKLAAEMTSTCTINKKVLGTLGAKKQLVSKTIFKLSPQWEKFLRQLAKISDMTIRDFLDSLATIATKAYSNGTLQILPNNVDGKRMSYAISEDAKNVFTKLAKENEFNNPLKAAHSFKEGLIDINGKFYLTNWYETYPTDIELNYKNKGKITAPISPYLRSEKITKEMLK